MSSREGDALWRYGFDFTLSPSAAFERELNSFAEVFEGRRLTQYHIWRYNDSHEPIEEAYPEDILIESNTDQRGERATGKPTARPEAE